VAFTTIKSSFVEDGFQRGETLGASATMLTQFPSPSEVKIRPFLLPDHGVIKAKYLEPAVTCR
jgi:hypothetical protein